MSKERKPVITKPTKGAEILERFHHSQTIAGEIAEPLRPSMTLPLAGPGKPGEVVTLEASRVFAESHQQVDLVRRPDGKALLVVAEMIENEDPDGADRVLYYTSEAPLKAMPGGAKVGVIPGWPDLVALPWVSLQDGKIIPLTDKARRIIDDDEVQAARGWSPVPGGLGKPLPFLAALKRIREIKVTAEAERQKPPRMRVGSPPKEVRSILEGRAGFTRGA